LKAAKLNRWLHYWLSLAILLPVAVIIGSGLLLILKKDVEWIQPSTKRGAAAELAINFDEILAAAESVEEANIKTWDDIDNLDVRPSRGVVKVRGNNSWEVQIDASNGAVLGSAYRRSDLIESIHDGTFFGDPVKYWVVLPTALILLIMWGTGVYLFALPFLGKRAKKRRQAARSMHIAAASGDPHQ
jgi:uncharacterized iron-regulated membrane protein